MALGILVILGLADGQPMEYRKIFGKLLKSGFFKQM
jgi:hypothetical protein